MRFILYFLILLMGLSNSFGQVNAEVFTEQEGESFHYYVRNSEVIPVTVDLKLKLTGMTTDFGGTKGLFVVPPGESKYRIVTATANRRAKRVGASAESYIYYGDETIEGYDEDHIYLLPYDIGKKVKVYQGYNGRFSHQRIKALDFGLSIGDKIYASRGGLVTEVEESNDINCNSESCKEYNNYVRIYHDDGTFAEYTHLDKNGVIVNVGDHVEAGEEIAISGNTGWSSGPHLHFVVYKHIKGERKTLKTKFDLGEGNSLYLKEGMSYIRKP